jgi:hypothetical protein
VFDFFYREAVKTSFRDQGIVKKSVLDTDETNRTAVLPMWQANPGQNGPKRLRPSTPRPQMSL